jgi:hypothetical protein
MKFFRNGGPADLITALKHEWLVARFGKVERGHKAVMAAADNDDVARVRHYIVLGCFPLWLFSVELGVLCGQFLM